MKRIVVACLAVVMICVSALWAADAANALTAQEQKEGYELLFDGKSLDKFVIPPGQEKVWRVVDGVIRNESAAPGATILTREDFGNYVLKAEFRAHPNVNSAIMLRQGRPRSQG